MIGNYHYCGYTREDRHGNIRIWGAVRWYCNQNRIDSLIFWGSPNAPVIKGYRYSFRRNKKETLAYKVKEKRKNHSGYTELTGEDIQKKFPELESQIGMYMLHQALKRE